MVSKFRRPTSLIEAGFLTVLCGLTAVAAEKPLAIPGGSTLRVRLGTTLTDKTNETGDKFTGVVTIPIVVNGEEVVPAFSQVTGHVAFIKPSGRVRGRAQMRIVVDSLLTPDNLNYPLAGTLEDAQGGVCGDTTVAGQGKADEEGTITGCGKSTKKAVKDAAIGAAIGAAGGASVGAATRGGCDVYGNCYPSSGPSMGADIGYGAAAGVGTALIYTLLKHEKHIVLTSGMELIFTVNRTTEADSAAPGENAAAGATAGTVGSPAADAPPPNKFLSAQPTN